MTYQYSNKNYSIICIVSLFIIAFSLGFGWSLIKPYKIKIINLNNFNEFKLKNKKIKMPHDELLSYKNADILFFDTSLKIQEQPFIFLQMITKDDKDEILKTYQSKWTDKKLIAIINETKNGGNIEAIDYINKRFLNVFIYFDEKYKLSEIYATALNIDFHNIKKIQTFLPSSNNGINISGMNQSFLPWNRKITEQPYPLKEAIEKLLSNTKNFKKIEDVITYPFAWIILYDEISFKRSYFLFKEIPEKNSTLCIEMTDKENL